MRGILIDTGVKVVPGVTAPAQVHDYTVYGIPEESKWKISLLESLLEIRDGRWEVLFEEENTRGELCKDEVTFMIDELCIS